MLPNAAARNIPVTSAVVLRPPRDRHRHEDRQGSDQPTRSASTTSSSPATWPRTRPRRRSSTSTPPPSRRSPTDRRHDHADISNTNNAGRESPLGDVIGDAQLAYTQTQGAQFAFMNPGGIRADPRLRLHQRRRGAGTGDLRRGLHGPTVQQPRRHPEPDRRADQGRRWSSRSSAASAGPRRRSSCRCRPASPTPTTRPCLRWSDHVDQCQRRADRPDRDLQGGDEQLPRRRW